MHAAMTMDNEHAWIHAKRHAKRRWLREAFMSEISDRPRGRARGRGFQPPGRGGFGPGGFGPPFGGGPWGHRPGGRGGKARRGDVRLAALLLLAEEPRNGYGIMQEIEQRSEGAWRASPGSVYPALSQLEDEGLVSSRDNPSGSGRLFTLTDAGRTYVDELPDEQAPPWQTAAEGQPDAAVELKWLMRQTLGALGQVLHAGTPEQVERARDVLSDVRSRLYRILADDDDGGGGGDDPSTAAPTSEA